MAWNRLFALNNWFKWLIINEFKRPKDFATGEPIEGGSVIDLCGGKARHLYLLQLLQAS